MMIMLMKLLLPMSRIHELHVSHGRKCRSVVDTLRQTMPFVDFFPHIEMIVH